MMDSVESSDLREGILQHADEMHPRTATFFPIRSRYLISLYRREDTDSKQRSSSQQQSPQEKMSPSLFCFTAPLSSMGASASKCTVTASAGRRLPLGPSENPCSAPTELTEALENELQHTQPNKEESVPTQAEKGELLLLGSEAK